jgi:CubicO group peptidase (beta-lactamase class C family)
MKPFCVFLVLSLLVASSASAQVQKIRENAEFIAQVALLERWIQAEMEFRNQPGLAIAVVSDQDLVWSRGFGYADVGKKIPMTPQTIFRIASITKTFTSTAILQLRDRGALQLDDPVAKYLPWFTYKNRFPEGPAVTIRQLLTHTSGLPRESAMPYWTEPRFPTHEELVALLHTQESIFETETKWKYSNLGMALLGEVVAAVSGQQYDEFITRNILQPLGMTSTSVNPEKSQLSRYVTPYGRRLADGTRKISPMMDAKAITPAAGISSTVEDMAKFASLHMLEGRNIQGQIVKGSTLREMHRVQWVQPNWRSGYGLGFSVRKLDDRVVFGHGGWVGGNKSQLSISPKEKVAVIVAINADDGVPAFFADRAMSMLAPIIARLTTPAAAEVRMDSSWKNFLGSYSDPSGWDTEVLVMNNKLMMYDYSYPPEDNPLGGLTELTPEGVNMFRMSGEDGSGELVVFELGNDGKVVRVKTGENYIYPRK